LLAGLFKPTHGKVLVDGKNIFSNNTITQKWMKNIGYVPQNILLIDDTIKNNIILGLEPSAISEDLVTDAINKACLKELIESLPNGLNTFVGEKGVKLSGGQRQRVGIARALLRNPSILFFDEGTSALDDKTETEVIKSIAQLSEEKTIIMIAHKLSTLKHCHKVYEINQNIIEVEC
jgi:ABC-type multidrug transport system fused ATPase/permease subunit